MTPAGYPWAGTAAASIQAHFAQHMASSGDGSLAAIPDVEAVQAIVDAAFWASLRREEGYAPRISLALVTPEEVTGALEFEQPFLLAPQSLTRVAPAVERPGIHLGVCRREGKYWVWGATRQLPPYSFVLEVVTPGVLVIKHSRAADSGKFVNVAVIDGEQVKIIDQHAATLPDCPPLVMTLLGRESPFGSDDSVSVLIELAASMRAHRRGGSLLVVPANSQLWRESILQPITYSVTPLPQDWMPRHEMPDALYAAIEALAGLTAVDGATIITDQYELMAFGAKIIRPPGSVLVNQVMITEPIEGATPSIGEPAQLGGTRHLSAAQFVHDQRDALAMVASQDGGFTVFGWSHCEAMVHAHRIEALLL